MSNVPISVVKEAVVTFILLLVYALVTKGFGNLWRGSKDSQSEKVFIACLFVVVTGLFAGVIFAVYYSS